MENSDLICPKCHWTGKFGSSGECWLCKWDWCKAETLPSWDVAFRWDVFKVGDEVFFNNTNGKRESGVFFGALFTNAKEFRHLVSVYIVSQKWKKHTRNLRYISKAE